LGARIRQFRQLRRLSLRELGSMVQISAGFLSQLERGDTNASVSTLRRIASALGLTVADLFDDATTDCARVLRKIDRPMLHAADGVEKYLLSRPPLRHLEVYQGELAPGATTGDRALSHGASQELLVVTLGRIVLELGGSRYQLDAGDSIEYESSAPHRVWNESGSPAAVLWIISPPTDGRLGNNDRTHTQ
jgi:transcriptional regulator with XRE-family HTH domain